MYFYHIVLILLLNSRFAVDLKTLLHLLPHELNSIDLHKRLSHYDEENAVIIINKYNPYLMCIYIVTLYI